MRACKHTIEDIEDQFKDYRQELRRTKPPLIGERDVWAISRFVSWLKADSENT